MKDKDLKKRHVKKIFKRFYSNRPEKFGEHSGLGLNIVKNLVDLHGGKIKHLIIQTKKEQTLKLLFQKCLIIKLIIFIIIVKPPCYGRF